MTKAPVGVALVDQQRVLVDAMARVLADAPGIKLLACTTRIEQIVQEIDVLQPDVLVLDAELPGGASFDAAHRLRYRRPGLRMLFLANRANETLLDQALRVHASGVVLRSDPLAWLVEAIEKAAQGQFNFSKSIASQLEFDPGCQQFRLRFDGPLKGLTDRQIEILKHLARGDSVKTVARKLLLSPKSVDNHKLRIMSKLGVRDKVSLALLAVREGLIEP